MRRTKVEPWSWPQRFGFVSGWRVEGAQTLLFLAGQGPVDADGTVVSPGDFDAQTRATFNNLQAVLAEAGATFESVVKLTTYLTDISRLQDYARIRSEFMRGDGPASTLIGVAALAFPAMMIEIDAVAVL
jgi:enamine deaminase RidA (YjgF/YER057c/UK114 family)